MNHTSVRFFLKERDFHDNKEKILENQDLTVSTFRYSSGVAALEVKNRKGSMISLPFQGQQIWDAAFNGRRLTMHSPVIEPQPTREFLMNMGAFLFHCGMTAMGSPGPEDKHVLHGELVNAPFKQVYIDAGKDEHGSFVSVGGTYEHAAAFGAHYLAQPCVRLYEDETLMHISMRLKNLNRTPMEYMYLAHINFLPVDFGRFVYSADPAKGNVHVRENLPPSMQPSPQLVQYVKELVDHPEKHHVLDPNLPYDPEIVFLIDYQADENGWAHALHVHPDGTADYVSHKPAQLDTGIRWICRTPNQEALGMEAATAGPEGYTAEKKKGKVKVLPAGGEFVCEYFAGLLSADRVPKMETKIAKILGKE